MIVEFTELTSPAEIAEIERYLTFIDDIYRAVATGEELLAAEAAAIAPGEAIMGFFARVIVIAGAAMLAYNLIEGLTVESRRLAKNKERRRKKTAICASHCVRFIEATRQRVSAGRFEGKALETEDSVQRYQRTFKSRA